MWPHPAPNLLTTKDSRTTIESRKSLTLNVKANLFYTSSFLEDLMADRIAFDWFASTSCQLLTAV